MSTQEMKTGLKVRATQKGYYGLTLREEGTTFWLRDCDAFSENWMEEVDEGALKKATAAKKKAAKAPAKQAPAATTTTTTGTEAAGSPGTGEESQTGGDAGDGDGGEAEPSPKLTLVDAIHALDPDNDAHWIGSGLPAMNAVEALVGDKSIKRLDVAEAVKGYNRDAARLRRDGEGDPGTGEESQTGGDAGDGDGGNPPEAGEGEGGEGAAE